MKKIGSIVLAATVFISSAAKAQQVKETKQDLPKEAAKGKFHSAKVNKETGNIEVMYHLKGDKNEDVREYQKYIFDKDINFVKEEDVQIEKEEAKPDKVKEVIVAQLGNGKALSMESLKLHLTIGKYVYKWDADKGSYRRTVEEGDEITLQNEDEKYYTGYAAYSNHTTGDLFMLGMSEKDGQRRKVSLLHVKKSDKSMEEFPIDFVSPQGLVYSGLVSNGDEEDAENNLANGDMIFVFAPKKADPMPDQKKYTYIRIDNTGKIKERFEIDAPSPNMTISSHYRGKDGAVYFTAGYNSDMDVSFEKRYGEVIYLVNPAYPAHYGEPNERMVTYHKDLEKRKMDVFSIIKINNGKVEWISKNPIENFEDKLQVPPGQKRGYAYDGRFLNIAVFEELPNGDFIITGQINSRTKVNGQEWKTYEDLMCFQLDKQGMLKAQYSIVPATLKTDINTFFPIKERLILAQDGKSAYLQLLENESTEHENYAAKTGQAGGVVTYHSTYYPSVLKFDINEGKITDYTTVGDHNYKLRSHTPYIWLDKEKAMVYIGSDGRSTIWLGRYQMN